MKFTNAINFIAELDLILFFAITLGAAWGVRSRMQRRVKMDLGKTVDDNGLLSIQTWMKVDEIEKRKNPCRDWAPESTFVDRELSNGERSLLDVLIRRLRRVEQKTSTQKPQRWSMRG
jgi:hypothetical protein